LSKLTGDFDGGLRKRRRVAAMRISIRHAMFEIVMARVSAIA
jgi:hypothetical protein